MKKILIFILSFSLLSLSCFENGKKDIVEKKSFRDANTFVIICKGWPKENLTGVARVESAKEAALINAQFIARDMFDESVDVVKNGTIEKYNMYEDYVTVQYTIKYVGLKNYMKSEKR